MQGNTFGRYLRALRKAKGLTQVELGEAIGYSEPYLSQIETGSKIPSTELLRAVSNEMGVTYIGMMIKAGYVTEEEVLTFRREHGINDIESEVNFESIARKWVGDVEKEREKLREKNSRLRQ